MTDLTRDAFFEGRLTITQSRNGYRFSIDAVLLAAAVTPKEQDTVLDLGTGSGIIPIILAHRYPGLRVSAVEIQSELAWLAQQNVADNRLEEQIQVIHADLRSLPAEPVVGPFDWVISNPPYRCPHTGRVNPNNQRAVARHEITVDLEQLLSCTRRMLRTGGSFGIIFAAERTTELLVRMRHAGIEPKRLQAVHSQVGQEAVRVLVQGIMAGRPGLRIAPPLIVYRPDGTYSQAVQAMMRP